MGEALAYLGFYLLPGLNRAAREQLRTAWIEQLDAVPALDRAIARATRTAWIEQLDAVPALDRAIARATF